MRNVALRVVAPDFFVRISIQEIQNSRSGLNTFHTGSVLRVEHTRCGEVRLFFSSLESWLGLWGTAETEFCILLCILYRSQDGESAPPLSPLELLHISSSNLRFSV